MNVATIDNAEKSRRLELLQEIIHDLICELDDSTIKEIVPNQTKNVGLFVLCQFRRREKPDQIESLSIQEGQSVFLADSGNIVLLPSHPNDFPDALDFNIYPGL